MHSSATQTPPYSFPRRHEQPLLHQTLNTPPRRLHSPHSSLTQPPRLLHRLLLPPRLRLATPTRRHPGKNLHAIMRREVHEIRQPAAATIAERRPRRFRAQAAVLRVPACAAARPLLCYVHGCAAGFGARGGRGVFAGVGFVAAHFGW
jgi:hypothetical protein